MTWVGAKARTSGNSGLGGREALAQVTDRVDRRQNRENRGQNVPRERADAVVHHRGPGHVVQQEEVASDREEPNPPGGEQLLTESFQTLAPTVDHPRDRKGSDDRGEEERDSGRLSNAHQIGIVEGEKNSGGEQNGMNDLRTHVDSFSAVWTTRSVN